MRIAISNIGWPAEQDEAVADLLQTLGVRGIEIAPTRIWPQPLTVADNAIEQQRRIWTDRGLAIVSAQALLFGRPDLTLFESREIRGQTLCYLSGIARLCGRLGAKPLVFGSPKNRLIGSRDRAEVEAEAIEFFRVLAEQAQAASTVIVLEANPREYGADYLTHAAEAQDLVRAVDHPGLRLHLDTACMTLAGDDPAAIIPTAAPWLAHFHASEPFLVPLGSGSVDHAAFARQLRAIGYDGWVSIEMRTVEPFTLESIRNAVLFVLQHYAA